MDVYVDPNGSSEISSFYNQVVRSSGMAYLVVPLDLATNSKERNQEAKMKKIN